MMNYGYGWGYGLFPFIPLLWVIFWIAVIFLLFGGRRHWKSHWHPEESAEDILRERFAKGEVDEKEYKERMRVLRNNDDKK